MLVENVSIHKMATFLVSMDLLCGMSVKILEEVFQLYLLTYQFPKIPSPIVNPQRSIFGNLQLSLGLCHLKKN
jgi:hypothetical protein